MLYSVWTRRIGALAVGLGLAMSAVIVPCWWSIARYHSPSCSAYKPDFISLYTAAKLMRSDRSSVYDLEKQRQIQESIDPSRGTWVLPFFYPPFFALMLLPLAWLSFSKAFVAMTIGNFTILAVAIRMIVRKLQLNREQVQWLLLATFCNYGVHYALLEAQTSFIALLLLVLFILSIFGAVRAQPGIWSGLMFFKPQLLPGPFLILLGQRRWRDLSLAFVTIVFWSLISLAAVGPDGLQSYFVLSGRAAAGDDFLHIQPEGMHNLRALSYYFFPPLWRDAVWWIISAILILLIVTRSSAARISNTKLFHSWTSVLLGLILISPHLHSHDLTLLILPFAFIMKSAGEVVPPRVALQLVTVGILPLINSVAYPHLPPLVPIALLLFVAVDFWRETRSTGSPVSPVIH